MGKTIVISNQKGGVGKTTTVVNLAACLGQLGKTVLVLDLDPQGNSASGLNIELSDKGTMYDVLINDIEINEIIYPTSFKGVSMIPANDELSGAQVELVNTIARETKLKKALEGVSDEFDFIFIDTPPSLGLLTLNGLTAATSVLIPIQCEYYALEGISQLLKTIKLVKQSLNPKLGIEGVCLTMFDSRTNLSKEVMENILAHFKEKTYKTIIPRNVKISEAPSHGQPIHLYWPGSIGAKAYQNFASEFLERNK